MGNLKNEIIKALAITGETLKVFSEKGNYNSLNKLIDEPFYEDFERVIAFERHHNGWFTPEIIRKRLGDIAEMLDEEKLKLWSDKYEFSNRPKRIGIIMAGNIPLVGFHDLLSVLISGNNAIVKMASDDQHLLPQIVKIMAVFYPEFTQRIEIHPNFKNIDAMLATGSDNSAKYFEKYFGHLPCLIRQNRTSIAIIDGTETDDELKGLGHDVFDYYGLGCRNVSQLLIPEDFDMDRFFAAVVDFSYVTENNKYANNYDYYRAVYLMNLIPLIENGFLLTKNSDDLFAPVAVLNVKRYRDKEEVLHFKQQFTDKIQAVIGHEDIPFGQAQKPSLSDYADGVDVIQFLNDKFL